MGEEWKKCLIRVLIIELADIYSEVLEALRQISNSHVVFDIKFHAVDFFFSRVVQLESSEGRFLDFFHSSE